MSFHSAVVGFNTFFFDPFNEGRWGGGGGVGATVAKCASDQPRRSCVFFPAGARVVVKDRNTTNAGHPRLLQDHIRQIRRDVARV